MVEEIWELATRFTLIRLMNDPACHHVMEKHANWSFIDGKTGHLFYQNYYILSHTNMIVMVFFKGLSILMYL